MFADRADAGRRLATLLDTVVAPPLTVLGLPRGGAVVGAEVARILRAPFDVIVVRKLGAPHREEFAMGAIGEDGCRVIDEATVAQVGASAEQVDLIERRERALLDQRVRRLRSIRPRRALTGRTAVIVDDGLATGATARAACRVARALGAPQIVLAVPVAPASATVTAADRFIAVEQPDRFVAVSVHYADFREVSDDDVAALLVANG